MGKSWFSDGHISQRQRLSNQLYVFTTFGLWDVLGRYVNMYSITKQTHLRTSETHTVAYFIPNTSWWSLFSSLKNSPCKTELHFTLNPCEELAHAVLISWPGQRQHDVRPCSLLTKSFDVCALQVFPIKITALKQKRECIILTSWSRVFVLILKIKPIGKSIPWVV